MSRTLMEKFMENVLTQTNPEVVSYLRDSGDLRGVGQEAATSPPARTSKGR